MSKDLLEISEYEPLQAIREKLEKTRAAGRGIAEELQLVENTLEDHQQEYDDLAARKSVGYAKAAEVKAAREKLEKTSAARDKIRGELEVNNRAIRLLTDEVGILEDEAAGIVQENLKKLYLSAANRYLAALEELASSAAAVDSIHELAGRSFPGPPNGRRPSYAGLPRLSCDEFEIGSPEHPNITLLYRMLRDAKEFVSNG